MANVQSHQSDGFLFGLAAVLMLLCLAMSGLVIAGAETILNGVMMIGTTVIIGALYAWLAVRAQLRAERLRDANRVH